MLKRLGERVLVFDDHSGNARSLAQTIRPGNIVKGRIFSNDDSRVRIAIERGAASIVTSPRVTRSPGRRTRSPGCG